MPIEKNELTKVDSPVSEALVLICEKCGKKLSDDPDKNPARALASELKQRIKAANGKGVRRALVSGCMDVCPNGAITIAIVDASQKPTSSDFFIFRGNTEKAAEAVLEKLDRRGARKK